MKLQVALDTLPMDACIDLLNKTQEDIDIAEVGTPFLIKQGVVPVSRLKERYPRMEILADAKIMDAGEYEADVCFQAGADIVTVLGVANYRTIEGVVRSAKRYGGKVMVDMIEVPDLVRRSMEIDALGVDYICVHTAFDVQGTGKDPLDDLKIINHVIKNARSAVAGGVDLLTIDAIVEEGADIVVVGGAICQADEPSGIARQICKHIRGEYR